MPTDTPAILAARSAASTTRRFPTRPTMTIGASGGGAKFASFRLNRSVDQVGRKSDTTLGIACLHSEICAFSGAATDEFDEPAGPPNARHRQRRRRNGAD